MEPRAVLPPAAPLRQRGLPPARGLPLVVGDAPEASGGSVCSGSPAGKGASTYIPSAWHSPLRLLAFTRNPLYSGGGKMSTFCVFCFFIASRPIGPPAPDTPACSRRRTWRYPPAYPPDPAAPSAPPAGRPSWPGPPRPCVRNPGLPDSRTP